MRIAITAKGQTLDHAVDPRFGRCTYFVIVDTETMATEAIENPNTSLGGGAGIQSAQVMAEKNVEFVLTGNCGPNASRTLDAAGIRVAVDISGTVREAVEQFKAGEAPHSDGPNVQSHSGNSSTTA